MEKIKFSAEKLATCPLNNGREYVSNGCGCAYGISYYAAHGCLPKFDIDNNGNISTVGLWRLTTVYNDPFLKDILNLAESKLIVLSECRGSGDSQWYGHNYSLMNEDSDIHQVTTPEGVRKWLMDKLNAAGYLDTSEVKEQCLAK